MTNLRYALRDMAKSQQNSAGLLQRLDCDWDRVFGSELELLTRRPPVVVWAIKQMERFHRDAIHQGLRNNLYDNHPGEIDRWRDDGGR